MLDSITKKRMLLDFVEPKYKNSTNPFSSNDHKLTNSCIYNNQPNNDMLQCQDYLMLKYFDEQNQHFDRTKCETNFWASDEFSCLLSLRENLDRHNVIEAMLSSSLYHHGCKYITPVSKQLSSHLNYNSVAKNHPDKIATQSSPQFIQQQDKTLLPASLNAMCGFERHDHECIDSDYIKNIPLSYLPNANNNWLSPISCQLLQSAGFNNSPSSGASSGFTTLSQCSTINQKLQPTGTRKCEKCVCPYCCDPARQKSMAEQGKRKTHICHICNKEYGKTSHLRAHIRGHRNERPFICHWRFCHKSFTRSDELQRHTRTHTGEKRFICELCTKAFSRSDHLKKHKRTHSNGLSESSVNIIDTDIIVD